MQVEWWGYPGNAQSLSAVIEKKLNFEQCHVKITEANNPSNRISNFQLSSLVSQQHLAFPTAGLNMYLSGFLLLKPRFYFKPIDYTSEIR